MAEDAGNGESVESYYRQYTGAVRWGCACGGDGGAGCGGWGYGVCGDCAVSEVWSLRSFCHFAPPFTRLLFEFDNMLYIERSI